LYGASLWGKKACLDCLFTKNRLEVGLERAGGFIHHIPWEYPLLAQTTVSVDATTPYALPSLQDEQEASQGRQQANIAQDSTEEKSDEQGANNYERVKEYLAGHPDAKVREVARALTISVSTANKWMIRIRGDCLPCE
jgi:hypothetical protein